MLVFPNVLRFMYESRVKFLSYNVILLLMGICEVECTNNTTTGKYTNSVYSILVEIPYATMGLKYKVMLWQ